MGNSDLKNAYHKYLQSDDWKRKSQMRITIDGKCKLCGKPFDLQVHHLTYQNVPNEKYKDLITLCRGCHQKIEKRKRKSYYDSFSTYAHMVADRFCKEMEEKDKSAGGDLDFCKLDVIKKHFSPYAIEHGVDPDYLVGTNDIQAYFRNKRYKIILDFMEKGYPENIVYNRTLFSRAMIKKVYLSPETAKRLCEYKEDSK